LDDKIKEIQMDRTYTRAGKTKGHKKSSHGNVMGDGT